MDTFEGTGGGGGGRMVNLQTDNLLLKIKNTFLHILKHFRKFIKDFWLLIKRRREEGVCISLSDNYPLGWAI